jgi:hypothetical protein
MPYSFRSGKSASQQVAGQGGGANRLWTGSGSPGPVQALVALGGLKPDITIEVARWPPASGPP